MTLDPHFLSPSSSSFKYCPQTLLPVPSPLHLKWTASNANQRGFFAYDFLKCFLTIYSYKLQLLSDLLNKKFPKVIMKQFLIGIQIIYNCKYMRNRLTLPRTDWHCQTDIAKLGYPNCWDKRQCIFSDNCKVIKTSPAGLSILLLEVRW